MYIDSILHNFCNIISAWVIRINGFVSLEAKKQKSQANRTCSLCYLLETPSFTPSIGIIITWQLLSKLVLCHYLIAEALIILDWGVHLIQYEFSLTNDIFHDLILFFYDITLEAPGARTLIKHFWRGMVQFNLWSTINWKKK